ncbi:MAG TPA: hypothetical protein VFS00_28535, partial [Polyangiaceae bacterium]|nr:hypothetical protein [Polyangiaceae bacterium]
GAKAAGRADRLREVRTLPKARGGGACASCASGHRLAGGACASGIVWQAALARLAPSGGRRLRIGHRLAGDLCALVGRRLAGDSCASGTVWRTAAGVERFAFRRP